MPKNHLMRTFFVGDFSRRLPTEVFQGPAMTAFYEESKSTRLIVTSIQDGRPWLARHDGSSVQRVQLTKDNFLCFLTVQTKLVSLKVIWSAHCTLGNVWRGSRILSGPQIWAGKTGEGGLWWNVRQIELRECRLVETEGRPVAVSPICDEHRFVPTGQKSDWVVSLCVL